MRCPIPSSHFNFSDLDRSRSRSLTFCVKCDLYLIQTFAGSILIWMSRKTFYGQARFSCSPTGLSRTYMYLLRCMCLLSEVQPASFIQLETLLNTFMWNVHTFFFSWFTRFSVLKLFISIFFFPRKEISAISLVLNQGHLPSCILGF